jgi:microcystin-dependent protein
MAEIGDKSFTTDMITLIKDAVIKELGTNAFVNRYLAEVTAVNTTTSDITVKLSGSDTASDGFRARGIHLPDVGQQVIACIDGQDRWIESVIRPTTSTPYVTFATAAAVPTGAIVAWATGTAPTGWLLCNGSTYAYNTYPALGALRGASAGGNFTVPDMRDRFIGGLSTFGVFSNTTGTIGPNSTITNNRAHTHTTDLAHGHGDDFSVSVADHSAHYHTVNPALDQTDVPSATTTFFRPATGTSTVVANYVHLHDFNVASTISTQPQTSGGTNTTLTHTETLNGGVTSLGATNETSSDPTYGGSDISPKSTLLTFIIKT